MADISDITDIVELRCWATGDSLSVSALKEELEALLQADEMDLSEDYARQVFEEIELRIRLLASAYPFSSDGTTLNLKFDQDRPSYVFCLALTLLEEIANDLRTREFEGLVQMAAARYFCGEAVRVGAPWPTPTLTTYQDVLKQVTELIPEIGPPIRDVAPGGGDAGWDLVVVNNFVDRRFARLVALGNCATGKTNWRQKGLETEPTLFWSYFTRTPVDPCLTFLAVPFLMSEDERLAKQGRNSIAFDRIRICSNAPTASDNVMQWLEQQRANAANIPLL